MDRRKPNYRLPRFFKAYCIRIAYRSGRRAAARAYESQVADLSSSILELEANLSESESDLAKARSDFSRRIQDAQDDHQRDVRELKRQIATLTDSVEIKEHHIAQLTQVVARDRERVAAELAEASRRIEEVQHDPGFLSRPINEQR